MSMSSFEEKKYKKFTFTDESREYIKNNYTIEDMLKNEQVIERSIKRIEKGVKEGSTSSNTNINSKIEILSYPLARIIVSILDDYRIISEYSKAEAQNFINNIENSKRKNVIKIISGHIDMKYSEEKLLENLDKTILGNTDISELKSSLKEQDLISVSEEKVESFSEKQDIYKFLKKHINSENNINVNYSLPEDRDLDKDILNSNIYKVNVIEYLKKTSSLNSSKWSITNKGLDNGKVILEEKNMKLLMKSLLKEDIQKDLPYKNIDESIYNEIKEKNIIDRLKERIPESNFEYEINEIDEDLFPPVIKSLLKDIQNGKHLEHMERFTVASFLINLGMTNEEILDLLEINNEFGRKETLYQLNHIREGRTTDENEYVSPSYDKIESWDIEWKKDSLEEQVNHPITYYKIKLKNKEQTEQEQTEQK